MSSYKTYNFLSHTQTEETSIQRLAEYTTLTIRQLGGLHVCSDRGHTTFLGTSNKFTEMQFCAHMEADANN
jgi:hypothetical protein